MGFKKVSMCFMSILLICYLWLPTKVIAEDQWKGDDFNSYPIGALVSPPDGWQSLYNRMWSIASGGVTGNALFFAPNNMDLFVHPSDASDYEISVQIKHSLIPTSYINAGLVTRCSDKNSYYSCFLYTNIQGTQHTTVLALAKGYKIGSITSGVILKFIPCFNGDIDSNTYYTLSMGVIGSFITATLSGMPAIPSVSLSYTDDGITHGPVLTGGYVGVYSEAEVSFHPYFDNFTYVRRISLPWLLLLLGD